MKIELNVTVLGKDEIGIGILTVDGVLQEGAFEYNGMMSLSNLVVNFFCYLKRIKLTHQLLKYGESISQYNQRCNSRIVVSFRYN